MGCDVMTGKGGGAGRKEMKRGSREAEIGEGGLRSGIRLEPP